MLPETLRSILSVSPKGRTSLQIARILEKACVKSSRSEILAELDALRRQRVISIDGRGRWHLKNLHAGSSTHGDPLPQLADDRRADGPLQAVRLTMRSVPERCPLSVMHTDAPNASAASKIR